MNKFCKNCLGIALATATLAGCVKQEAESDPDFAAEPVPVTAPMTGMAAETDATSTPAGAIDYAAYEDVQDLVEQRSDDYTRISQQAQSQGFVGGALRGALIALIVDADPAVIAGGAIVGGIIGAQTSEQAASSLVMEHKNYLIRRWSLERVLASVKTDSKDTRFDLLLSDKMVTAAKADPEAVVTSQDVANLNNFKSMAVSRAVTLREVMALYDDNPAAQSTLESELKSQLTMIALLEQNLTALEARA